MGMVWRAGTTTLCRNQLYPPVRYDEFGYYMYSIVTEQRGASVSGTAVLEFYNNLWGLGIE